MTNTLLPNIKNNLNLHALTKKETVEKITVMAQIVAKEEKRDFVKSELLKLLDLTRAEKGCINYILHQDKQNPNLFVFYENWTNKDLLDKHLKSEHIGRYIKNTEECVDDFILHELEELTN